jgi:hypothetical protein
VSNTTFNGGYRGVFTAMKVPRQCPLVLPIKTGLREGTAFGSGS